MKDIILNTSRKICLLLSVCILIYAYITTTQRTINAQENKNNNDTIVNDYIEKNNLDKSSIEVFQLNKRYLNITYQNDNSYFNQIIKISTNEEIDIDGILKKDKYQEFEDLLNSQIDLKYPLFVSSALKNINVTKAYYIKDNGITIKFNNYTINPTLSFEPQIDLTCNQLVGLIKYTCNIDTDVNPNEPTLDKNKKTVAITFDDGPNNNTLSVLQTLKENHAKATFFMVGNMMNSHKEIVKQVLENGNEIGSHSYDHSNLTKLSNEELKNNLSLTESVYNEITNEKLSLLRPPYGSINSDVKESVDYSFILWSLDSEDWKSRDANIISEDVLNTVQDGDVILLHDIHLFSSEALKTILPELYARGYQVVTVSQLSTLKDKPIQKNSIYRSFR